MTRIPEVPREQLSHLEPMLQQLEQGFGFVPNDYLAMAHKPALAAAVIEWTSKLFFSQGKLDMPLRIMIAYVASKKYGCMYCTSHCISLGSNSGIPMSKIENIDDFETNPLFSDSERAALRVAKRSYEHPDAVTDKDFEALRDYYDNESIVEIVSLISMMAFYTKWNDIVRTAVEAPAYDKAVQVSWWHAGKHQPDQAPV